MSAVTKKVAPPNSVVLVSDSSSGEIPKTMGGQLVSATDTCIAVGCMAEDDGQTEITLASLAEVDQDEKPSYEGMLRTPKHRVVVRSVLGQQLLELSVAHELTRIKIWANDPSEPDRVVVGVG